MRASFSNGLVYAAGELGSDCATITLACDEQPTDGSVTSGAIKLVQLESLHDALLIANDWKAGACLLRTLDGVTVDAVKSDSDNGTIGNVLVTVRRSTEDPTIRLSLSLGQAVALERIVSALQAWLGAFELDSAEERDRHGV